jgi:hypothetical protein
MEGYVFVRREKRKKERKKERVGNFLFLKNNKTTRGASRRKEKLPEGAFPHQYDVWWMAFPFKSPRVEK